MEIVILLLINILILNVRLWLIHSIFRIGGTKWTILFSTGLMGILSTGMMMGFPYWISFVSGGNSHFDMVTTMNRSITILLIGYMAIFLVLLTKLFYHNSLRKIVFYFFVLTIFFFILIGLGRWGVLSTGAIYYLFVAYGEERSKFLVGRNVSEKFTIMPNDIILFCVLSGLGFCFFENIVYLFSTIVEQKEGSSLLRAGTNLIVSRGIINFMVHSLFTSTIAYFVYVGSMKQYPIGYVFLGGVIGIGLHRFYNLGLSSGYNIIILPYFLLGYFWLSYLLYHSDRLYLSK